MYSFNVNGSTGFWFSCAKFVLTLSQMVHWFQTNHQLKVISTHAVGSGYFQIWVSYNERLVTIFAISDCLTESRASLLYHWSDMKAIVHRIARIVITTCILKKDKTIILYNIVLSSVFFI